ncbi:MAG: matrixin family metalloprotease, partial [Oligoflexia bacterium]|nr:matrixin family metalloprotease [Oligoflexia bacterium]
MILISVLFMLFQQPGDAFNISSTRWSNNATSVIFSSTMEPVNAPELVAGAWIDLTKESFNRWTLLGSVRFDLEYPGSDCAGSCEIGNDANEIYWYPPNYAPIFLPASALGVTLRRSIEESLVEVDIVFNRNYDLVLNPGNNTSHGFCIYENGDYYGCYDYPSVATHEIGHFFGIDHTSEDEDCPNDARRSATMFYSLTVDNNSLISLEADDIAAITCIYPYEGEYYRVDDCCLSQNPFDRYSGCSHAFSDSSNLSLDIGPETAGCGHIDVNDDDFKGTALLIISIPLLVLLFLRLFGKKPDYGIYIAA